MVWPMRRPKALKLAEKKTRLSELIRRLRQKGITYKEIARICGCSQGAIATELKLWEKEKKEGRESIIIEEDIPPVIIESSIEKIEIPLPELPKPVETIRF